MVQILISLIFLYSTNSNAFTLSTTNAAAFETEEIIVNVGNQSCNNIGVTNDEILDMAKQAIEDYWNRAPTSNLKLKIGNVVETSSDFYTQPICQASTNCTPTTALIVSSGITISCNNNSTDFSDSRILAVTVPNNLDGKKIQGALLLINDRSGSQFANKTRDEMTAVIAHEIGHAIGLGHSPVNDSLMYFQTVPQRRSLGEDDIDGAAYLYPQDQPFGCGTVIDVANKNSKNGTGQNILFFCLSWLLASSFIKISLKVKKNT